jgi:hypothetical protein
MKPRVEAETVFGQKNQLPVQIKDIGAMVINSVRVVASPDARANLTHERMAVSREAKERTVGFTRFLRKEFGEHLTENGLLFRTTSLPYELSLEAIREGVGVQDVTTLNMRIISPAGQATQFYVSNAEQPGARHPILGSQVRIATVTPMPQQREVFEGEDYTSQAEVSLCHDVTRAMDDFEYAYNTGDLEIYQLATDRTRDQIYS